MPSVLDPMMTWAEDTRVLSELVTWFKKQVSQSVFDQHWAYARTSAGCTCDYPLRCEHVDNLSRYFELSKSYLEDVPKVITLASQSLADAEAVLAAWSRDKDRKLLKHVRQAIKLLENE